MPSLVRAAAVSVVLLVGAAPVVCRCSATGARPIRSLRELRYENVVPQRWDVSCGAAALSALLTYDHDDPVTEEYVVSAILKHGGAVRVRSRGGFSLLDLKRFADARGYESNGYLRVTTSRLLRMAPAIVPTVIDGYDHFVVFRGIREGRVLLGDPTYGIRTLTIGQFEASWPKRVAFVVRKPGAATPAGAGAASPAPVVPPAAIRNSLAAGR